MADKVCSQCNQLFRGGDKVRATVLTEWKDLKSTVVYALGFPTECLEVVHRNCQMPQGEIEE